MKVHDKLFQSLEEWAEVVGVELGAEGERLFCSAYKADALKAAKITGSVIGTLVAQYGFLADLAPLKGKNGLNPHDIRRSMARNAYDNGAGLILVQQVLGHSYPKTTAQYIGAYENDGDVAVDYVRY